MYKYWILNTLEHSGRPLFFKNLSKVFQRFKEFSVLNTIFIDEPDKALLNPVKYFNLYNNVVYVSLLTIIDLAVQCIKDNTGVFPVTYDPLDKNDDFLGKF